MFFLRSNYSHPEFRIGVRDMLGTAPGVASWGLMTGVAMVKSGMSLWESLLMALTVFAGSSQLAAIPLIGAGAPMWVILAAGFCVNLRFVVFSAHLRPYMLHLPASRRLISGYLTADLTYVLFTRRFATPGHTHAQQQAQDAYLAGNCLVNWGGWVGSSLLGIALSNVIPTEWGLGFAGILALIGILCSLATSRLRVVSGGVAASAAIAAWALPLKLNILVAIAAAVACCLLLEPFVRQEECP
jgi:predicted branched-subunit amino acid permease